MEMSPKAIASTEFPLVRKGFDPGQVKTFLAQLARGVEDLQNRALQAEARARLSETATPPAEGTSVESLTRTLVIAQRTADATLDEARKEAEGMRREAEQRAEATLTESRARAENLVAAAEAEASRQSDLVNARARAEAEALGARRQQLLDDIERLRSHIVEQRERIAATVDVLRQALEHPDGLRDVEGPEISEYGAVLPPPGSAAVPPPPGTPEHPVEPHGEPAPVPASQADVPAEVESGGPPDAES